MVTINNTTGSSTFGTNSKFNPLMKDPTTGKITHAQATNTATTSTSNPFDTVQQQPTTPVSPIEGYSAIKSSLGTPNKIDVPSVFNMFKDKGPEKVQGLDPGYFQTERDRRRNDLREEFFGPSGLLNKTAYDESGAGRLGSGVSKRIIENTVTNPFTQRFTEIDSDIAQEQWKEQARVQETNAKLSSDYNNFLGNLASADSGNYLQAQIANNEIQMSLDDLAARLGSDYAKQMNDYELEAYSNYIDMVKAQMEQNQFDRQHYLDQMKLDYEMNK